MNVSDKIRNIVKQSLERGLAYSFLGSPELLINNQVKELLTSLDEEGLKISGKDE